MTQPDIVAELDRWLVPPWQNVSAQHVDMVKRARDEIVALQRRQFAHWEQIQMTYKAARVAGLEEAVQVIERMSRCSEEVGRPDFTEAFQDLCSTLVDAIRSLKGKRESQEFRET